MAWLYREYIRSEKLYTIKDIIMGLKLVSGKDYESFFEKYIIGAQIMPVSDYFNIGKAAWFLDFGQEPGNQNQSLFHTLGITIQGENN